MIYKSYLLEQNINSIKNNIVLFYGENLGLKNELKEKIKQKNKNVYNLNTSQDEILLNKEKFFLNITNKSLFEEEKIIFINQANEKIIDLIEEINEKAKEQQIYLFSEILEKKSKLRIKFEKSSYLGIVPCYPDNELTIKKIIHEKLKNFKGLSPQNINTISDNSNFDRAKLNNELNKIVTYFTNKVIHTDELESLLNLKTNEDFNNLKDEALNGNKKMTNILISNTILEQDKNILYLNLIKQRLLKISEVNSMALKTNLDDALTKLRPPIFWKDLPIFKLQTQKWNKEKINNILNKTLELELRIKSKATINPNLLIRNFLIEICTSANS